MSIMEVNCDNLQNNPSCAHGPTLKFSRLVKGKIKRFYACSACRDRKDCPFFLEEGEVITPSKLLAWNDWKNKSVPRINHEKIQNKLMLYKQSKHTHEFCLSCFDFIFPNDGSNHKGHEIKKNITNDVLSQPSIILPPLSRNKKEAQYWFCDKSKRFIVDNITHLKFSSVICLGAPTIHEIVRNKKINSLLLDIDHRYHWFYDSEEFCWFNMFNFHFMGDEEICRAAVHKALDFPKILIAIDPPFGARIEPLKKTIEQFINLTSHEIQVILILPYFMEPQVLSSFPDFKMLDYQIEYLNHNKFKNKESKKPSPVRIFTDIIPERFLFPKNDGYRFCELCKAWRSKLNEHCTLCVTCPSKNGDKYKHCCACKICVKWTWVHCSRCQKCCLADHICGEKIERTIPVKNKRKK